MTDSTTQATAENTQTGGGTQTTDTSASATPATTTTPNPGETTTTTATAGDAATKPGAEASTETPAEVVYDLKLPEGMQLDETVANEFKAIAKELKLAPDAAQKLVDLDVKRQQAAAEAHVTTVKAWRDSVVNDAEIGGDKLAENMATARKAIALGPPELSELLKTTGMDNHPTVFRWALAVGKALSEDRMVSAGTAAQSKSADAASVLYPSNS